MGKQLTREEWMALKPPFHWLRVRKAEWHGFLFEIVEKYLYNHTSGFWYHGTETNDEHIFIFESDADMVAFKLWLTNDPFSKNGGEIT
jgi:hypothetical protein